MAAEFDEFAPPGFGLVRPLGRGGTGAVWAAHQRSTGRTVALKLLHADLVGDGDRKRFDRERRGMGALAAHPHILTILDAGVHRNRPWIAMELCAQGSLADWLRTHGPLTVPQGVRVLVALANALQTAHDRSVLHCDIKPANILVSDFGQPMLADFGIARTLTSATAATTTSAYTLDHAPPEVLDNRKHSVIPSAEPSRRAPRVGARAAR